MLKNILKLFDQHFIESSKVLVQFDEQDLQFASIALLIEMMHIDDVCTQEERSVTLQTIADKFALPQDQAQQLIIEAEAQRGQATDYYQFTRLINKGFTPEQKIQLIENLWTVAFADGVLDLNEEHMVRKISDLLHVPHHDFLKMKFRVESARQ